MPVDTNRSAPCRKGRAWLVLAILALLPFSLLGLLSRRLLTAAQLHYARHPASYRQVHFSGGSDVPIDFGSLPHGDENTVVRIRFRFRGEPSAVAHPNLLQTAPGNDGVRMEVTGENVEILYPDMNDKLTGAVLCTHCATGAWHTAEIAATRQYLYARIDDYYPGLPEVVPNLKFSDIQLGVAYSPERTFRGEIADFEATFYETVSETLVHCVYYVLRTLLFVFVVYAAIKFARRAKP